MRFVKFICLSILLSYTVVHPLNIKLLKGTHTILPDSLYAPFRGLIFLDENIAQQWYLLSPSHQTSEIKEGLEELKKHAATCTEADCHINAAYIAATEVNASKIITIINKNPNSATESLILQLFNMAGGTFNITSAPNNPVRQLTPYHIGSLLRIIYENTQQSNLLKDSDYKKALLLYKGMPKPITKEIESLSIQDLIEKYPKVLKRNLLQINQLYLTNKITNFLLSLTFKKPSGSLFEKKDFNLFVTSIIDSLNECGLNNPNQIYPEGTMQGLLLSYMLAKVNNHADLQSYFQGFLDDITYQLPQIEFSREELEELAHVKEGAQQNSALVVYNSEKQNAAAIHIDTTTMSAIADYICALVYTEKYCSEIPKIVTGSEVTYEQCQFPDCVETAMYNLVNIITYNSQTQSLGNQPVSGPASQELQQFYHDKAMSNPDNVGSDLAHNNFAPLVENIEGCSYNRCAIIGTTFSIGIKEKCDGCIPLHKTLIAKLKANQKEITINNQQHVIYEYSVLDNIYWLIPHDSNLICYELLPTLSNVIILLNKLLSLNLAKNHQTLSYNLLTATSKEIEASFFKRICKQLRWTIQEDIAEMIQQNSEHLEISITLPSQDFFKLELDKKMHASVSIEEKSLYKNHVSTEQFNDINVSLQAALLAAKAIDLNNDPNKIDFNTLTDKFVTCLNKDQRIEVVRLMHDKNISTGWSDDAYLAKLLTTFTVDGDGYYQRRIFDIWSPLQSTTPASQIPSVSENIYAILELFADNEKLNDEYGAEIILAAIGKKFDTMWQLIIKGLQRSPKLSTIKGLQSPNLKIKEDALRELSLLTTNQQDLISQDQLSLFLPLVYTIAKTSISYVKNNKKDNNIDDDSDDEGGNDYYFYESYIESASTILSKLINNNRIPQEQYPKILSIVESLLRINLSVYQVYPIVFSVISNKDSLLTHDFLDKILAWGYQLLNKDEDNDWYVYTITEKMIELNLIAQDQYPIMQQILRRLKIKYSFNSQLESKIEAIEKGELIPGQPKSIQTADEERRAKSQDAKTTPEEIKNNELSLHQATSIVDDLKSNKFIKKLNSQPQNEEKNQESSAKEIENSFNVLGLTQDASFEDVKIAYKKAALAYHPDKFMTLPKEIRAQKEIQFKKIQNAYDDLKEIYGQ